MYLFGTIHALPSDVVWLKGHVQSALEQSDLLMLEKPEGIGFLDKVSIVSNVLFHARPPIKDRIRKDRYHKLRKILKDQEIEMLDRMPTVMAQAVIDLKSYEKGSGKRFDASVEETLAKMARSRKKAVSGFETAREQYAALSAIPESEMIHAFEESIDTFNSSTEAQSQVLDIWLRGDGVSGTERVLSMRKTSPQAYEIMLHQRNLNWMKWLERRLKKQGVTFVAVGAAHLHGPDGLIESLKGKGFQVVRVAE